MKRIAGGAALVALLFGRLAGAASPAATVRQEATGMAGFDARLAEARAALVKQLEGHAAWCHANDLFAQRAKTLELVLELAPEHAEALRTLGYTRAKGGGWKAPEKPKTFRDFDKQALEEAPARWRDATQGHVAAMVALLEGGALSAEQKELAAREALRFDPDHERVHALLGEVRIEDRWVLPETVRAVELRELLRNQVREALEGAPAAVPAALSERERKIPLRLRAVAAPGLRVVGSAGEEELLLASQAVLALERLLQAVFASRHGLPEDCTIFLLANPTELPAFVENHPAIAPAQRAAFQALEGGGIQGTSDFAFWTGDTQRRIDGVVRLALGYWLSGAFQLGVEHGWVYEGFGLALTRALVRTRMTWMAEPGHALAPEALALRQKLIDPETNWMDEALRLVQEKRQPPLAELFRKGASELAIEDLLYSYALATYLLETRVERLPDLFTRLGRGVSAVQGFREITGMDGAAFERHFQRWLTERT